MMSETLKVLAVTVFQSFISSTLSHCAEARMAALQPVGKYSRTAPCTLRFSNRLRVALHRLIAM